MSVPTAIEASTPLSPGRRARAMCAVAVAKLVVRLRPLHMESTLRWVARGSRPATYDQAADARAAACTVSATCAGLGCLLRSVATYLDCRLQGTTPDWCTGFRLQPFAAHAWVEVGGVPVGEPGSLDGFHTVAAVRPHQETT